MHTDKKGAMYVDNKLAQELGTCQCGLSYNWHIILNINYETQSELLMTSEGES